VRSAGAPAIVDAFGAIAHPVRRQIVSELAGRPRSVTSLAERLPVSRPAVSQHLRLLLDLGLVRQERVGREHRYQLVPAQLDVVRAWLVELDARWGHALARLGEHLEQDP